ncbi:MAG: hypothetical protein N2445_04280, partial [Acidobacteria bacterium]|nr:hypothetical protein [Acidobacteriota bacterium]
MIAALALFFTLSFLLWISIYKGYFEKATFALISRYFHNNNITFTAENFSGSIRQGITIEKPVFKKGKTEIKADKIYIRARRTPILWGTFWIKEFAAEGVEATIEIKSSQEKKEKFDLPFWLTIFAKNVSIKINKVAVISENGIKNFENCRIETNFSYFLKKFAFRSLSMRIEKSPLKNILEYKGNGEARISGDCKFDGEMHYGQSFGKLTLILKNKNEKKEILCRLDSFALRLRDLRQLADFPDLEIYCNSQFSFSENSLKIKGVFEEQSYGRFTVDSVGKLENDVLSGSAKIS